MKKHDILWKGIIEDLPHHFIRFFFPQADDFIDFNRGFEFLDKELEELIKKLTTKAKVFQLETGLGYREFYRKIGLNRKLQKLGSKGKLLEAKIKGVFKTKER